MTAEELQAQWYECPYGDVDALCAAIFTSYEAWAEICRSTPVTELDRYFLRSLTASPYENFMGRPVIKDRTFQGARWASTDELRRYKLEQTKRQEDYEDRRRQWEIAQRRNIPYKP